MFIRNALTGKVMVVCLLIGAQLMVFTALDWMFRIGMNFLDAKIAGISFRCGLRHEVNLRSLEKREIMCFPIRHCRADDPTGFLVNYNLRFYCMSLFLA